MKRYKNIVILIVLAVGGMGNLIAQQVFTLDDCHRMALEANKGLKMSEEKKIQAEALEKVALWQMLPKVSANGAYLWMEKDINLISEEQKEQINNMGTTAQGNINSTLLEQIGQLSQLGLPTNILNAIINSALNNTQLEQSLNAVGHQITDGLSPDMNNVVAGAVTITQPIYLGGKLRAAYRSAQMLNELSGIQYDKKRDEMLLQVDEAYWQVVSVTHKKALAEQYASLLRTLNSNVEEMVKAEVATQGDLAQVRVKLNEAEMQLTNATNGLMLAKMLLAQRCGMPLNSNFEVQTLSDATEATQPTEIKIDMDSVWSKRSEMRMLRISDTIAQQGVRMAASSLKPNVIATGGYLVSNPNIFNGFQKEFNGTFTAGIAVNIPIFHPGGAYAVKAAKAKRREIGYQMEEAQEMIELQVEKTRCELELAYKKKAQAESNLTHAEENLRLADESYKSGMCSSSDLMAAQTAWMKAQGEIIDANIEIELGQISLRMVTYGL